MDKETASQALNVALDCGAKLNKLATVLENRLDASEYAMYGQAIGRVMGELLRQLINPIVEQHEDLRPPQLTKFDKRQET